VDKSIVSADDRKLVEDALRYHHSKVKGWSRLVVESSWYDSKELHDQFIAARAVANNYEHVMLRLLGISPGSLGLAPMEKDNQ
jgi:hypothetical protein